VPELPEIETIRLRLRNGDHESPSIVGRKILSARLFWNRTLAYPTPDEFQNQIQGEIIQDVLRRGKFFVFPLSTKYLLIHLRMSGDLIVEDDSYKVHKHHRLIFSLSDGIRFAFNNPRKFGRVWLLDDPKPILGELGPEPLDPDFTKEDFYGRLHPRRRQLKPLLMDQHFLAGLGNIYTDESLFRARLHPVSLASTLTRLESENLFEAIRDVLRQGILRNGASIDWVYRGGDFQNYFFVYRRTGEPCYRCGTPIKRIIVGQRSTHFCPNCQRLSRD